jgi:hypothetical protein
LLNDALDFVITMFLKLKKKVEIPPTLVHLINDDLKVILEMFLLTPFLTKYDFNYFSIDVVYCVFQPPTINVTPMVFRPRGVISKTK